MYEMIKETDGVTIVVGEAHIGLPMTLAKMVAEVYPTINVEAPDYTLENIIGSLGQPSMFAVITGTVETTTIKAAKAFRLGKPEGYPDDDDLFLVLCELDDEQTGICVVGEDAIKAGSFQADADDCGVCYVPIDNAKLAEFFQELGE